MLVPLMFLPDLEGTSKTPECRSKTRLKPQLHTQKNHNCYNGTRTLPIATLVRPQDNSTPDSDSQPQREDKPKSESKNHKDESPLYEITLYYPHNRACTIYRSREDFWLLRTGLLSSSSSTAPQPLTTLPTENREESEGDSEDVDKWDAMLKEALKRFKKSGHGRHSVEWFLRRRLGDCERMASGKGTGLPTGTTRRVRIKKPRNMDDMKTTDERAGMQGYLVDFMAKLDEKVAVRDGVCLHEKDTEEEDDVISRESWTDDERGNVKDESVKDEGKRNNNGRQPDRERDEANDNTTEVPTAEETKERQSNGTEVVIGLDMISISHSKPLPDLSKLEGQSIAARRKSRQMIDKTGPLDQKTVPSTEGTLQRNMDNVETSKLNSESAVGVDTDEDSSSDGTTVLTPTSSSAGEMSPGDPPPNEAHMYKFMYSPRASDSDWGPEDSQSSPTK
ncbi:hypothetical protein NEUTE1DRAFT_106612 [Neurospora tetrasperma FGSC 2508]|uniref:Uncharacterized protein n=1 Tax=Neurospora tetrasperma (strain FGSC 2508 / ATCC MYA-4615 / P0657) TaxID=510951 RepID=F8N004_NEUT8|nr:uncharacterized protein NEUTE1DRAFT_106612 [Neurospora tetrasperma FGSC 2508]EGO53739.1 hypothetical protein NEUTE1DRAFT_106612 [Neurospora tetrasperma FGSC 2508]EGZ76181.1 hypothetical protein NEUTE2DRAFT_133565 [Neurospora tetrasperma FGSC 2509]